MVKFVNPTVGSICLLVRSTVMTFPCYAKLNLFKAPGNSSNKVMISLSGQQWEN